MNEAEIFAKRMADLELCKYVRRLHGHVSSSGVTIHDLQHDFCLHVARHESILEHAHVTLLDGYLSPGDDVHVRS